MTQPTCPSCDSVAGCQSRERLCPNLAEKSDGTFIDEGTKAAIPQPEQKATWHPTQTAITALKRFEETCTDNEGYDVPKDTMRNLAAIGLIYRTHGDRYCITDFGRHILETNIAQPEQTAAQKSRTESEIVALAYTLSDCKYFPDRSGKVAFKYDQLQAFVAAIAQPEQTTSFTEDEREAIKAVAYRQIAEDYRKKDTEMFSGADVAEWCECESLLIDDTIAQPEQPAPVRQPLKESEIQKLWDKQMCGQGSGDVKDFVRDIEAAHGITKANQ